MIKESGVLYRKNVLPKKKKTEDFIVIDGIYIENKWMAFMDYPEPPDCPEIPTIESLNQYDAYRKALQEFSKKHYTK